MRRLWLVSVTMICMASAASPVPAFSGTASAGPGAPTVTPEDLRFTPGRTLRPGSAQAADLLPEHVAKVPGTAASFMKPSPEYPQYPGAVVLAARRGVVVSHEAMGHAVRYESYDPATKTGVELPPAKWVPTRKDTIYDMASVTKLFTSIAVVQQIEAGKVDLSAPVTTYIPEFAAEGKGSVTVQHLMTHTSGLPAWLPLYSGWPTPEARIKAVYDVKPLAPPDTRYTYSDLNLITLGKIVEKVAGKPLDEVVASRITEPLDMPDTGFNPPASKLDRIAATEWMPQIDRGMVRGSVHDENAWSLNGVSGHAGIFSTATDLSRLAQAILNGGRYGRARILREDSVRKMLLNYNSKFPASPHGLGFDLNQFFYMGALSSPVTAGHTGFTGPSLTIDPISHSFVVFLANRVHPTRDWGSNSPARRAVSHDVGRAIAVRPAVGRDAWYGGMPFSGPPLDQTATLTLPVPEGSRKAKFALWYDIEPRDDKATLEATTDGTTWKPVPMRLRAGRWRWSNEGDFTGYAGRRWARVAADLPEGTTELRWRYILKPEWTGLGRGIYVDGVNIRDARGKLLLNAERDPSRFKTDGWTRERN